MDDSLLDETRAADISAWLYGVVLHARRGHDYWGWVGDRTISGNVRRPGDRCAVARDARRGDIHDDGGRSARTVRAVGRDRIDR